MAPEIGAGKYDRGIDIYAMGALLFEMLTGQVPFFGASPAEVLMKHLTAPLPLEGIEEPFATAIRRAMAKDPAERFQSVQEMVEAVFGAEHVRQSVSVFSPDSLTMVAGRVARHALAVHPSDMAGGSFDPSTVAPGGAGGAGTWFDRVGQGFAAVGNRVTRMGQRVVTATRKFVPKLPGPGAAAAAVVERLAPSAPPPPPVPVDPLPGRQRLLLTLIATAAVSVGVMVMDPEVREPPLAGFFVMLFSMGAGFAIRWASRNWLPALRNESRLLRHLAVGSLATVIGLILGSMVIGPEGQRFRHLGETLGAICLSLLIIDWGKRTDPQRPERLALGDVVYAAIAGLVTSLMLHADTVIVVGALAATCMAAQVGSPWLRQGSLKFKPLGAAPVTPLPIAPAVAPAPAAPVASNPTRPMTPTESVVMTTSNAGKTRAECCSIVGGFFRLVFGLFGTALLLAALAGALALAYDLPGVMAVGGFGPEPVRDLAQAFDTPNWPPILRAIIALGMFLVALGSGAIFLMLRRRRGGFHMLRGATGMFLLLWAPFVLFNGVVPQPLEGRDANSGWAVTEVYLRQIQPTMAIRAAVVLLAGVMMMMWPARGRVTSAKGSEAARVDGIASR
jgi:hypothetical protein